MRCTRPLSESILYTEPFNRFVLSTAEAAGNPRILELCDELEALGSDPQAPGSRMFHPNLMAHVRLVRQRNSAVQPRPAARRSPKREPPCQCLRHGRLAALGASPWG